MITSVIHQRGPCRTNYSLLARQAADKVKIFSVQAGYLSIAKNTLQAQCPWSSRCTYIPTLLAGFSANRQAVFSIHL